MLAITRRKGEKFLIGNNVWVCILGIDGGQVRVGIEAPRSISIVREELLEKDDSRHLKIIQKPAAIENTQDKKD